jgi:RNA polymerase sigma factor (sigma-70 family)
MRRMLRRMLGNEHDALDAYQDCIYHLARRSGEIPLRCAAGYAYRTAANLALEMIRVRQRRAAHWARVVIELPGRRDAQANKPGNHDEADLSHLLPVLRGAVRGLPKYLRDVVVLRDLAELPYTHVARILGIRPTTARVYRRQAIVRLGQMMSASQTAN